MSERVLIVEDDRLMGRAMRDALALSSFRAHLANTVEAGLALAVQDLPSVLVVDIGLPDGTGWDLLDHLRRSRPDYHPGIVVVSSNSVARSQLVAHCVDRFLPKPFDMSEMVATVRKLASGARSMDPGQSTQP